MSQSQLPSPQPDPTVVYVIQQIVSAAGVLGGLATVCWLAFSHIIADGETVSLVMVVLGVHTAALVNNKAPAIPNDPNSTPLNPNNETN